MNIQKLSNTIKKPNLKPAAYFAKHGEIGEGASIACDFFGKAVIVPIVIMSTSKEPKEKKQYSALKNPVAATIQLMLEVPILQIGSKVIANLANKGFFDVKNSDFSYNELAKKNVFINNLKAVPLKDKETKQKMQNILNVLKEKGYSKKLNLEFLDFIKNVDDKSAANLKKSFDMLEKTHKNQFHLANRICFLASILLTPLLCALENKIHPIIMDKFFKKNNAPTAINFQNIDEFIQRTKQKDNKNAN